MSIHVSSNEPKAPEPKAAQTAPVNAKESAEPTQSAPEAKASEHNESETSGTSENEAIEPVEPVENDENEQESEVEGDEPEAKDEKEDGSKDLPKKKGGFQRRIDKLNARISAREQELGYWKEQALKGASQPKVELKSEPVTSAVADGKPNPDQFGTHVEYVEALTEWTTEQKLNERDQKREKSRLEIEQTKQVNSYAERAKAFAAKQQDYEEVLRDVDDIPLSPAIRDILISSENGPELAYEMAKNRDEYARICKLPPLAAAREMGKLEFRIASKASAAKPEPKQITKAPPPIEPVKSGKGSASKSIYDPNLSQRDYEAIRAKQRAKATG